MHTITATITARGANTTVPDSPGAVDATIYFDGVEGPDVTLLIDTFTGKLSTWGDCIECWCSGDYAAKLADMDNDDIIDDIVQAVRDAA